MQLRQNKAPHIQKKEKAITKAILSTFVTNECQRCFIHDLN